MTPNCNNYGFFMDNETEKKTYPRNLIAFAIPALIILTALLILYSKDKKNACVNSNSGTVSKASDPLYRSFPIMGTWAEISLYGEGEEVELAMNEVHRCFNEINDVCSRFDPKTELSRLNASAADKPFKCNELLWDVLVKSKYFYELSDGAFDVTITPLMKLWGFYRKQNEIPNDQEIKDALSIVGFDKVVFYPETRSISFKQSGISIDLGGIAKGYAVDYAYDAIKKYSVDAGVINLGGNIRFFPTPPPGKQYYFAGIRNPFRRTEIMDGTIKLLDACLATSGDYERFIVLNGKQFGHIIDPRTGYPVEDMAAVTIVAPTALECDALSTAVFINGVEFAEKIYNRLFGVNVLIVEGYHDKPETVNVFKLGEIWKDINLKTAPQN